MNDETVTRLIHQARGLQAGLTAWQSADPDVDRRALSKALRDNWDRRIGELKYGGVWSIYMAKSNTRHPASRAALKIPRKDWNGKNVTVEHAIPFKVFYPAFMHAETTSDLRILIDAYHVAVVTRVEDKRLRDAGLNQEMPPGWTWDDDPLARWKAVGIRVEF
ncbi:MAG: hypothetical protein F4Z15_00935 [Gammaproteobacteria bacterium]|nr:hypothetical protein [Gammaproteobacteria bacterium]MYD76602.1 hypothetical protein [Gammaproteobacteria bacterium]MYJ52708.1 hypothetical protein [Gammaproteobacteria bacterium]